MQTDRRDNSLRPGSSGGTRGSGSLPPGFDTAASNLPVLGPNGDAGVPLRLKAMQTSGDILKLKQEMAPELFLDDESWGLSDANSAGQAQGHYFGSGSRDWHGRSGQSTLFGDVKSWDTIYGNKESSQLNSGHEKVQQLSKRGSQFPSSYQVSSTQVGPAPALHKAEVAWSARRGNLRQKECVLKTVQWMSLLSFLIKLSLSQHFVLCMRNCVSISMKNFLYSPLKKKVGGRLLSSAYS